MDAFDFVNDPITAEQVAILRTLLAEQWSEKARDGFLVTAGRFVDETSTNRTEELSPLFCTNTEIGRIVLRESLEALFDFVGSLAAFERDYPVYINDPIHGSVGVFPQLPILGVHRIHPQLYRLLGSTATVHDSPTKENVRDYIMRVGKLPRTDPYESWILRKKPRYFHWCSYQLFATPTEASDALQILSKWSDCKLRATLPTKPLDNSVFVAYSGVTEYPASVTNLSKDGDAFAGYNVELATADHPELPGGGMQMAVVGEPTVSCLEEWSDLQNEWVKIWEV